MYVSVSLPSTLAPAAAKEAVATHGGTVQTCSCRGCCDFIRRGPGAGVFGKYLLLENEKLLFFALFRG